MKWIVVIGFLLGGTLGYLITLSEAPRVKYIERAQKNPDSQVASEAMRAESRKWLNASVLEDATGGAKGAAGDEAEPVGAEGGDDEVYYSEYEGDDDSQYEEYEEYAEFEEERDSRLTVGRAGIQEIRGGGVYDEDVIIYTTSYCGYCKAAIAVLDDWGIDYVEKDVEREPGAREEQLEKSGGYRGVPFIDVNGEYLRGYSKSRLERALSRL
jgi:glutaredoxin 3